MKKRIKKIRSQMEKKDIESLIIDSQNNIFYLTGFTGTAGKVLLTPFDNYFFTDGRYIEQANSQIKGFQIKKIDNSYEKLMKEILNDEKINTIHFESTIISYKQFQKYNNEFSGVKLSPVENIMEELRLKKDESEIAKIKKAVKIADKAFDEIMDYIKPGLTENEIALKLEYIMRKEGGSEPPFDYIVASGKRSSLPHGVASDKKIKNGDFVTMDFGIKYEGYCSDITRTVILGKHTSKQQEIYETVLKAQKQVIKEIEPGMNTKNIDAIARDIIKEAGYGDNFKHSLGHGLGIEVHEQPRISYKNEDKIEAGMVITNEPGIYISDWGGVRIEDDLLITDSGCEVLNSAPKELIIL